MRMRQFSKAMPKSALFLTACLFLLVACGSNTSTGSSSSSASATATACVQATRPASANRTAIGTLKSMNGQTLVVANTQGTNVTVTYSNTTTFTQEVKLALSDLKEGTSVRVTVTSTGSTYTATNVLASSGTTGSTTGAGGFGFPRFGGTPGAKRGTGNPCFANRGRFGNGTPGTGTGNTNFRGLVGTVSQISGDILTIADSSGGSYTVTVTAQTQIVETKSATSAALKVGEPLTVIGKSGSQGVVAASSIAILLSLPTRNPVATPTA